jgi:predicted ATP-grasp superfamily ATP-dependent carboligase
VSATDDPDAFVAGLEAIVRAVPHAVLPPTNDASLLATSVRRERLEPHVRLGLPPHEAVLAATDKIALEEAAGRAGLATPGTAVCLTDDDGRRAGEDLGFPLVIKPRRSVFEEGGRLHQRGGAFVAGLGDLEGATAQYGSPFLLQRALEGEVWSAAGVVTPEGIRSFSVARYLRTWPARAGNVAFAVTVAEPRDLRERVELLLTVLGWTGLFELELIRTPAGTFHAIDLNPRLYGSLAHAARAGAPHAAVFCDWVLGRDPEPVTARPGVHYRWEDADLRHALWLARGGRPRAALGVLRPRADVAHAHFQARDPGPQIARLVDIAVGGARRMDICSILRRIP